MGKRLFRVLTYIACAFAACGCFHPLGREFDYGMEDLAPVVSFSGDGFLELKRGNSITLTVTKSFPVFSTEVSLVPFSDKALADRGYRGLAPGQCSFPKSVTMDDKTSSVTLTVTFDITEEFVANRKYAVGFHLASSNEELPASEDSEVIIYIPPGEIGSPRNPYKIFTPQDMMQMATHLVTYSSTEVCFRLMNDIDMDGYNWIPLDPTGERPIFFDGGGHTIDNLTCIASKSNNIEAPSFFAYLWGTCQNVTFRNAKIVAYYKKAGVVAGTVGLVGWGRDHPGHLKNVHVEGGSVTHHANDTWVGWTGQAGGLAAELCYPGSTVENCTSSASVSSDYCAGGLFGQANDATLITGCSCSGDVTVSSIYCKGNGAETVFLDPSRHGTSKKWGIAGGLVGIAYNVEIANSYSTGTVKNTDPLFGFAGGLIGMAYMGTDVECCWSGSDVTGTERAGGIIGTNGYYESGRNNITKCVAWNGSVKAKKDLPGRVCGLMNASMDKGQASYGQSCFARSDMALFEGNRTFVPELAGGQVFEKMNTGEGPQYYHGTEAGNIISTAKDILLWDASVWDFSGSLPKLKQ